MEERDEVVKNLKNINNDESVEDEGDALEEREESLKISQEVGQTLNIPFNGERGENNNNNNNNNENNNTAGNIREKNKIEEEEENTEEEGGDGEEEAEEENEFKELQDQVAQLGFSQKGHNCGPYFDTLDADTIVYIFSFLELEDLGQIFLVCVKFNSLAKDDYLWQGIYETTNWTKPYSISLTSNWYHLFLDRFSHELFLISKEDGGQLPHSFLEDEEFLSLPPIEQMLRRKIPLFDLIDSDDFTVELRRCNKSLIQYLQEPTTIMGLLDLALKEAPFDLDSDRLKNRYNKVAHIAFQTLASEILSEIFIDNSSLLDYLFDFLNYKQKNTPSSASGYFAKITESLFEKFPSQSVSYFRGREKIIDQLVENVNDNFLMEMLFKFTDCGLTHQWLHDSQLLPKLSLLLDHSYSVDVQENAAQVLVNVFTLCQPWAQSELVLDIFNNPTISSSLIKYIKSENASGTKIKQGLSVLISILNLITEDLVDVPLLIKSIMDNVQFFSDILQHADRIGITHSVTLTTGLLPLPFGSVRLGILELFVALLYTGYPLVVEVMAREDTFSVLLDIFFEFPWNNIVHHQIVQIISGLLCANDDEILKDVLEKCRLIDRIVDVFDRENSNTVGYLGHLKEIANEIIKVTKYSAPIADMLDNHEGWMEFITGKLREINELEANDVPSNQEDYDGYSSDDYAYNQYDEEYCEEEEDYGEYEECEEEEEYEIAESDEYEIVDEDQD